jgi:hypothetical protein
LIDRRAIATMRAMRERVPAASICLALAIAVAACDGNPRPGTGDGCGVCTALGYQACIDGVLQPPVQCPPDQICAAGLGCVVCIPDDPYCMGNEIWQCNADGSGGTYVDTCQGDLVCSNGACLTPCEAAGNEPSNVGCDFWAVDLDNEAVSFNDATMQQFAVVIANNNDMPAGVRVTMNAGRVGQPVVEQEVTVGTVPPRGILRVDLPQREVDGTMGQNAGYMFGSGSHTFVSPHAYHITTTMPVVAYQFNPIVQQYSNDASILIPIQALGTHYYVVGFPTANPCGPGEGQMGHMASIPDHTAITIAAVSDDTHVTVNATHRIHPSGGDSGLVIPQVEPGTPLQMTLDRYDVANLESWQPEVDIFSCINMAAMYRGDFTGTVVTSDKPIVVFTALERGLGLGDAENVTESPNWNGTDFCCTEHFEEQLFPTTALGKEFAVARSAVRSTDPGWKEPDIYRVLATENDTAITTNLPTPYGSFTLQQGQHKDFWAQTGFSLSSTKPIHLAKFLVPQQYIPDGFIGDPSMALHPAAEQFRKEYVFLVPDTWRDNYIVISRPEGAMMTFDGLPFGGDEFDNCYTGPIGPVAGVLYDQITCLVTEGSHILRSDKPIGLMVFGYYSVGAYSFAGGSDVKIINPIE